MSQIQQFSELVANESDYIGSGQQDSSQISETDLDIKVADTYQTLKRINVKNKIYVINNGNKRFGDLGINIRE